MPGWHHNSATIVKGCIVGLMTSQLPILRPRSIPWAFVVPKSILLFTTAGWNAYLVWLFEYSTGEGPGWIFSEIRISDIFLTLCHFCFSASLSRKCHQLWNGWAQVGLSNFPPSCKFFPFISGSSCFTFAWHSPQGPWVRIPAAPVLSMVRLVFFLLVCL